MRNDFEGAIFEGVLFGGGSSRGSAFGTDFIPVYDPLCPANVMYGPTLDDNGDEESSSADKKCCGGESPTCKGCGTCGTR